MVNNMMLFRNEIFKTASSGNYNASIHDIARYRQYHATMEADLAYLFAQAQLDLPKTHPTAIELPDPPQDYNLDSPRVVFLLRLLDAGCKELVESQSSERASGVETHDHDRCKAVLDAIKGWIDNMEATQPIDAPEHANMAEL